MVYGFLGSITVAVYIIVAVICSVVAKRKGHNQGLYLLISLLLTPVLGIILVGLLTDKVAVEKKRKAEEDRLLEALAEKNSNAKNPHHGEQLRMYNNSEFDKLTQDGIMFRDYKSGNMLAVDWGVPNSDDNAVLIKYSKDTSGRVQIVESQIIGKAREWAMMDKRRKYIDELEKVL